MNNQNKTNAETMKKALENFSNHPERIENFIFYIENHFSIWMQTHASTPEGLTTELLYFSEME